MQDFTSVIEQSHKAGDAILRGDASGYRALLSEGDDVTLGNPFGPYVRGRKAVEAALASSAANYRDGAITGADLVATYLSDDLACVVEVERGRTRVGGSEEQLPVAVRVTSVFRKESGGWKLVHRHADPITTPRPVSSVVTR